MEYLIILICYSDRLFVLSREIKLILTALVLHHVYKMGSSRALATAS